MTGVVVLPALARQPRPWKNGGGLTYDVAFHPPGSDLDSFDWRVSIAQVGKDGPFSHFPSVQRTLALLEGELELQLGPEGSTVRLAPFGPPCVFAGDFVVIGRPGPAGARDLNLMVREGRGQGAMRWLAAAASSDDAAGEFTRLVLATAPTEVTFDGLTYRLAQWDALLIDRSGDIALRGASPCLLVEISLPTVT